MVSSYTTNKNLEKPGNGDYVDTWNVPLNGDMNIIDAAFGGVTSINATGGSATLSTGQYQNLIIYISGAIAADTTFTIPSGVGGSWLIRNTTTDSVGGPWSVIIASGGGGTSVACVRNKAVNIFSDGTNIREVSENLTTIGTVTSVDVSGGTTGLTTSGGPITTSGTITLAGTLNVAHGGTGVTTSTGTGSVVLSNSPTLVTPTLGVATATSINKVAITAPATSATLRIADGKTFASDNSLTLAGTDGTTMTFPSTSDAVTAATNTQTLTNKRVIPRINSVSSGASLTPNGDTTDQYEVTALATNATINAPSGTPTDGQKLIIRIKDNGTARTLTWTTTSGAYRFVGIPTITSTVVSSVLYVGCIYNSQDSYWDVVASAQQ
jgi:hypothetical protein